jgi:hypothetical protein
MIRMDMFWRWRLTATASRWLMWDVADDHREGGFFGGRREAGGFAVDGGIIYGGAVGGDLKGLEKIGGAGGVCD